MDMPTKCCDLFSITDSTSRNSPAVNSAATRGSTSNLPRNRTSFNTRVATGMIASIESPLDLLSQPREKSKRSRKEPPPA